MNEIIVKYVISGPELVNPRTIRPFPTYTSYWVQTKIVVIETVRTGKVAFLWKPFKKDLQAPLPVRPCCLTSINNVLKYQLIYNNSGLLFIDL